MQRELQAMVEERDDALLQMTNAQEQAKQNATALRNLQAVLEEFQRGARDSLVTTEREGGREREGESIIHESTTVLIFLQISPLSLLRLSSAHRLN